jgi:hypothetical protein
MYITLHVSRVKRSSSGVPQRIYSLQFLCLCLSVVLSCKKFSYKPVPQTDTNTETGGCMYGEGLLMMRAWRSKHVELYTYRSKIKIYHKLHLLVYLLEYMKMHGPGNIKLFFVLFYHYTHLSKKNFPHKETCQFIGTHSDIWSTRCKVT